MRRPSRALELARAMVVLLTCIVLAGFARPALAEIRIVALGDSGIYCQGVGRNETYPSKLERALKACGHDVSVANAGSNGDTTQGVLNRLDTAVPQGTQIVVLSVGVNDVVQFGIDPACRRDGGRVAASASIAPLGVQNSSKSRQPLHYLLRISRECQCMNVEPTG